MSFGLGGFGGVTVPLRRLGEVFLVRYPAHRLIAM